MRKSHGPPPSRTGRRQPKKSGKGTSTSLGSNGQPSFPPGDRHKHIQDLIDLLKRNHLTELEWEGDSFRVRLRNDREPTSAPFFPARIETTKQAASPAPDVDQTHPTQETQDVSGLITITSPIVGTFYRSASPEADSYVEEQDFVKRGQVVCIVEAMKLMNEIESEVDGRVMKILVESMKPVEYGQPLFLIEPISEG